MNNRLSQRTPSRIAQAVLAIVLGLVMTTTSIAVTQAQGVATLAKFVVVGGGGASSNERFQLTGTIGQPEINVLQDGRFVLYSGFWGPSPEESGGEDVVPSLFLPAVTR